MVERTGVQDGNLVYEGNIKLSCRCWWDAKDKIAASGASGYTGCSKTTMATKKNSTGGPREAIYIANVPRRHGIFIHYWPGPRSDIGAWSDGCILVLESDMLRIWNDISPKDGRNVTVSVKDVSRKSCMRIRSHVPGRHVPMYR